MSYSNERFTIRGVHTHVVRIGDAHFPAWKTPAGDLAVDLRTDHGLDGNSEPSLNKEQLRARGVPEIAIQAASESSPTIGFFLLSGQA